MEAYCVNLELKYQNQALKKGQHGQFSNVKSNEAKIKHAIDVIETTNIELEHKVAKLLKENETLKKHYKERYFSNDMVYNHYLEEAKKDTRNSSELRIHDHNNKQSSSKLVPKVVPPVNKIATSQQELELLFSPMYEDYFNAGNQSVSKSFTISL
nr:hypothetical protein [Tanacetum cinerariifolium]